MENYKPCSLSVCSLVEKAIAVAPMKVAKHSRTAAHLLTTTKCTYQTANAVGERIDEE